MRQMNVTMLVGLILIIVGIVGFAIPIFTTQKTEEVARVGDLKIQTTQDVVHEISPLLSGGVVIVGLGLLAAGLYQKR